MGRTVGFGHSTIRWDTWDMSGLSQVVLGLWDGKDSALYHGTLGTCLASSPGTLGSEGQWDLGTLPWDTQDMSELSQMVPRLWDGGIWHGTLRTCLGYPK